MDSAEIITAAIALLALLLGGGFGATWWHRRTRIKVSVFHQAMDGRYEVVVTVANGSDDERHLEEIHLVPTRQPKGHMTTSAVEVPVEIDLPPHGRPAKETLPLPPEWVDQRIPFHVKAKISARSKLVKSKKQNIEQPVLNVLDAP